MLHTLPFLMNELTMLDAGVLAWMIRWPNDSIRPRWTWSQLRARLDR